MSIFSKSFKPTFETVDSGKGLPLDKAIKVLRSILNMSQYAYQASQEESNKSKIIKETKSYLRGINKKCVQFEIVLDVETIDENKIFDIPEFDYADETFKLLVENLTYNKIRKKIEKTQIIDSSRISLIVENQEVIVSTEAIRMNENKSYFNSVKDFFNVLNETDEIFEYKLLSELNDEILSIEKEDFSIFDSKEEIIEEAIHKQIFELEDIIVHPISITFKNNVSYKWLIAFNPQLPENMLVEKNEFKAKITDKIFLENMLKNNEKFGCKDTLKCDVKYTVYINDGEVFADLKDIEVSNVRIHK